MSAVPQVWVPATTTAPERGHPGQGLRPRLIVGFVSVAAVASLLTAVTTAFVAVFIFASRPTEARAWTQSLLDHVSVRWRGMPDSGLVWIVLGTVAGMLVLSVTAGWVVAQRMLRPVRHLAAGAQRVAAGDLGVRLEPTGADELAELAVTFNTMTSNLESSTAELRRLEALARRFAQDVSHELRTPLAAMTAVSDVLSEQTEGMTPDATAAARLVVQEIHHLDRLVNDLIEMSRFDAGTAALDTDVVHLSDAVDACLGLRGWTDSVSTDIPLGLDVALDRRRFDVILANLVGNAIRYGAPPIQVYAEPLAAGAPNGQGGVRITVQDRGDGLPPEALGHIFERFYKARAARTRSDGSGLGLAIALENARLHGGTITAANRPDGGAAFTLTLPSATAHGVE